MIETLKNAFRNKDIRKKIIMTLLLLLLFRIGCYIPIPGLERATFETAITGNDFLALMSGITGNALANGTLFALGIGPYINASIIMQLLCVGIPALERLSRQGEEGKKKIAQLTRYLTLILAVVQAVAHIGDLVRLRPRAALRGAVCPIHPLCGGGIIAEDPARGAPAVYDGLAQIDETGDKPPLLFTQRDGHLLHERSSFVLCGARRPCALAVLYHIFRRNARFSHGRLLSNGGMFCRTVPNAPRPPQKRRKIGKEH